MSEASRRDFVGQLLKLGALGFAVVGPWTLIPEVAEAAKTAFPPPTWESWKDRELDVTDGWENWMGTIENPHGLPIFHDNFHEIPASRPTHHWVMVVDLRKCVGCQACVVACKSENNVPLDVYRTWVKVGEEGEMVPSAEGSVVVDGYGYEPNAHRFALPSLCNHCDHPPCVEVCPVKATYKRQDGPVLIDYPVCIGCGNCINACPYGARFFNPVQQTADKCTLCVQRIDRGLLPSCVTSCVGRARVFGDVLDPESEVSQLLAEFPTDRLKTEMGTDPQVYYIGLDGNLAESTDPEAARLVYTYAMGTDTTAYRRLIGEA